MTYQYSLTPCSYVCEPARKKKWIQLNHPLTAASSQLYPAIVKTLESKKLSLPVTSIWNTPLYSRLPAFCARSSWKNGCSAVNLRAKTITQSLANWQITYSDEFRKLRSQTKTSVLNQSVYTQNTNHLTRSSICGLAWKNRSCLTRVKKI